MADRDEEVIREIAAKHGVAVGRDDPIMILRTLNARLMEDSARAQEEILDRFRQEMEAVAHRWSDDAREKAERSLNAALDASKGAMGTMMRAGAREAAAAVQAEIRMALSGVSAAAAAANRMSWVNIAASVISMCAAGIALFAAVR